MQPVLLCDNSRLLFAVCVEDGEGRYKGLQIYGGRNIFMCIETQNSLAKGVVSLTRNVVILGLIQLVIFGFTQGVYDFTIRFAIM